MKKSSPSELMALGRRIDEGTTTPEDSIRILKLTGTDWYFVNISRQNKIFRKISEQYDTTAS